MKKDKQCLYLLLHFTIFQKEWLWVLCMQVILQEIVQISAMGALALAIGIAIQNFPEGAIISMPLVPRERVKEKLFLYGVLSGVVEL